MAKRMGLARIEALIENLKRDINLGGSKVTSKKQITPITGDTTLTTDDSGAVYLIAQGSSTITITMPTASTSTGCFFTFIVGSTGSAVVNISCSGVRGETFGAAIEAINNAMVQISATARTRGDRVDLFCDGVYYYAQATAHDVAHITIS